VVEHLSVRAIEEAVRGHGAGATAAGPVPGPRPDGVVTERRPGGPLRPPGLLELEELLSDYLDTRVTVTMGASRGKVQVEFATLEDLERIYRLITEATGGS
jgi:ParB family chromosome partitioning protein